VITDKSYLFDEITDAYTGPLYLEIVPLSFPIWVREDLSLNQLRLSVGWARLDDQQIREEHAKHTIVFQDDAPVRPDALSLADGLFLSLDLVGNAEGYVGYRARDNTPPLDLTLPGAIPSESYWEEVRHEEQDRLVLAEEQFYLLMSSEAVSIPPSLAAEMTAYDPTSGELRTHYAGFFDPGFGYSPTGSTGSRAALEVRAHDVPFLIEDRQQVCKLTFERMIEEPEVLYGDDLGSSYQDQLDALGKQFLPPSRPPGHVDRTPAVDPAPDQRLF
jgi:dCTP deaminase